MYKIKRGLTIVKYLFRQGINKRFISLYSILTVGGLLSGVALGIQKYLEAPASYT